MRERGRIEPPIRRGRNAARAAAGKKARIEGQKSNTSSSGVFAPFACYLSPLVFVLGSGCATQHLMRATSNCISTHIDPEKHSLVARSTITLHALDEQSVRPGDAWVAFDLNRNLEVSKVSVVGASLRRHATRAAPAEKGHGGKVAPIHQQHLLYLDRAPAEMTVTFDYYGTLQQDIDAGEDAEAIHNFGVSTHISTEGTYLDSDGHWYPTPSLDTGDHIDPDLLLADWRLEADRIADYELVASGVPSIDDTERYVWTSPHKLSAMTLTGGRHDVWSRRHREIDLVVHLRRAASPEDRAENEAVAQRYLDRTAEYIDRYESLLGPFPYRRYTIVENFFSSGFAFPMMTLFGPTVMRMGDNSFRHGYLDHELVHSWFGCGIEVDPRDGNWCESLTSYCTNYFGFVVDDDPEGARKKRRDESNFLSRIKPDDDKPLGTFGLEDGVGRGIAYSKGSAVFHMLARTIGQENFWNGCRLFTDRFMGRHADWNDLKSVMEEAGGRDLGPFFQQWVREGGAPSLRLLSAECDSGAGQLAVEIEQGNAAFRLDLPLRLYFDDGHTEDITVPLDRSRQRVDIPVSPTPVSVELDPDYHVFRKLLPAEIMPTTAATKSAKQLTIVQSSADLGEHPYSVVSGSFRKAVESQKPPGAVSVVVADDRLSPDALGRGGVLVLGAAVHHAAVQRLLEQADCPISWTSTGFSIEGQTFESPHHAVLCTIHHPQSPDDGITIYYGNSDEALSNAAILGFYANSLLVFQSNGRAQVVLRRDFESHQRIDVGRIESPPS